MDRDPTDINSKNTKKWTRRRIMRYALAAGVAPATAHALTKDDLRAAASDQVTIAFDVDGEHKKQVPGDWYNRVRQTNDVVKRIQDRFMGRRGVAGVGMSAGGNGDNPHILVTLDERKGEKEERRGEIPERENGVRIDIEEGDPTEETEDCDDERLDATETEYPGSLRIQTSETAPGLYGDCTLSPKIVDGDFNLPPGWTTAAHCLDNCSGGDDAYHRTTWDVAFGEVIAYDINHDIAYIAPDDNYTPLGEIAKPDDHSDRRTISNTLSEDGVATVDNENMMVKCWGINSCSVSGPINRYNLNVRNEDWPCTDYLPDRIEIEPLFGQTTEGGDSGAIYWVNDPDSGDNFAVASHQGSNEDRIYGVQAFTITDQYGWSWTDF
jgi:hypothetical protein